MAIAKKAVAKKTVAKAASKQTPAARLFALLEGPRYALLAKSLAQRGTLKDLRDEELSGLEVGEGQNANDAVRGYFETKYGL